MSGSYLQEELGVEFGIGGGSCYCMDIEKDFQECPHQDATWICTDTLVGIFFLFLKGEFVGCRSQNARKNDSYFHWKDKEAYEKVKKWFWEEFQKQNKCDEVNFIDFNEDLSPFVERAKIIC